MPLLDHPIISSRYFFQGPTPPGSPARRSRWCRALLRPPRDVGRSGSPPFSRNGEVAGDWLGDFDAALNAHGMDTCFAEYRGYGGSTGHPSLTKLLDDALAVFDAMGRDGSDVVVYRRFIS